MGHIQVKPSVRQLKKLWDEWNLPTFLLFSFMLQASLTYIASTRKRSKLYSVQILMWAGFLIGDWIAAFGIGQILESQNDNLNAPKKNGELSLLWAQFLLLHLAGPDNFISFGPWDNEMWFKQLFALLCQIVATIYSFFLLALVKNNKLWTPTILVFIVGFIKCCEKVKALLDASFASYGETLLPKPCRGLDYEEAVAKYSPIGQSTDPSDTQPGKIPDKIPSPRTITVDSSTKVDEFELLRHAGYFINDFKVLFTGSFLSSQKRKASREYFLSCRYSDAFRLIEYELSCLHDIMHTKAAVLNNPLGYLRRFICFSSVLVAFIFYLIAEKQRYARFDVALTYAMLIGTIFLDINSLIILIFSDWSVARTPKMIHIIPEFFIKRKRWSRLVLQYNMFTCCLEKSRTLQLYRFADTYFASQSLDNISARWSLTSERVTKELEEFIFKELKMKSMNAEDLKVAKEACSQRGLSALLQGSSASNGTPPSLTNLEWSIKEFHYLDSLLLWHLATELCFRNLDQNSLSAESKNQIKICKLLSDYMFYLLVLKPTMLSPYKGNWSIVFQDTQAEAMGFFKKHSVLNHDEACQKLISVETPYRPADVKGSESKSLLFDACILAKELRAMEAEQWEIMSRVWVELMSFAAISCNPAIHALQPSNGGELLTFTWLLMYHLGLGTQFSETPEPLAPTN